MTDIPGALGDSIIVPVSIINLPDTFATLNLSKFLGAGPAKYSPTILYFDKLGAISIALPEPLNPAETKKARPPIIPSAINVMKRELDNCYSSVVNAIQERP